MIKVILAFLLPVQALALTFEVQGPCDEQPIYETATTLHNTTLGYITEYLLQKGDISYTGGKNGIKSIDNSPAGDEALEVLSDTTMRSYGWCVEVDGIQPEVMPDKVIIDKNVKHVRWFYAFSFYDSGNWMQFCTPSYEVKSEQICK